MVLYLTLPKTNSSSLKTIHFQVPCQFSGVYLLGWWWTNPSPFRETRSLAIKLSVYHGFFYLSIYHICLSYISIISLEYQSIRKLELGHLLAGALICLFTIYLSFDLMLYSCYSCCSDSWTSGKRNWWYSFDAMASTQSLAFHVSNGFGNKKSWVH